MVISPTFQEARNDVHQRQPYLDNFLDDNPCDSVRRLVYNDGENPLLKKIYELYHRGFYDKDEAEFFRKRCENSSNTINFMVPPTIFGMGENHEVFIDPKVFYNFEERDLKYILHDKTYIITQDAKEGIPLPSGKKLDYRNYHLLQGVTWNYIVFSRALLQQTLEGRRKGLKDSSLFRDAKNRLKVSLKHLEEITPETSFEDEIIESHCRYCRYMFLNSGIE